MRALTLVGLVLSLSSAAGVAVADRPNIVYLMADDHALEAVTCYGKWLREFTHTPTIDRLAAEGMRFTNVCCNNSICSPSRGSIITGQYSHINGGLNLGCTLKPESPSYIVELQKAGYTTAVVGKWHMGQQPRGCDDYAVTKGQGKYFHPTFRRPDGTTEKHQGYYADVYTDWAIDWLKNRDKTKPFCLNLQFKGPHNPYDYPERWAHLHAGVDVPEPSSLHEDAAKSPHLKALHYSMMYHKDAPKSYYLHHLSEIGKTAEEAAVRRSLAYQHMIHKYLRCVAAIDDNVKRVVDHLETEGVKDETLIVYTSDQGYWLGQHNMFDKRLILEESLKMPFIVRYPKEIKPGSVCETLAMNIDFGPTMLDFAGVRAPEAMQGMSLRPLLKGKPPADWRTGIFYAYYARAPKHWGIRTEQHKLIHFPGTDAIEFYDLTSDPQEMTDVSKDPAYASRIQQAEAALVELMREVRITPEFLAERMKNGPKAKAGSGNKGARKGKRKPKRKGGA